MPRRVTIITTNITVAHDGDEVASQRGQVVRVAEVLSFQDGKIDGFAALMAGAEPHETRQAEMELTSRRGQRRTPRRQGRRSNSRSLMSSNCGCPN